MRRFLRYLRIAFSATCLIACVLLIALWVRSYWWRDYLYADAFVRQVKVQSIYGQLGVLWFADYEPTWAHGSETAEEWSTFVSKYGFGGYKYHPPATASDLPTFDWLSSSDGVSVLLPHWFAVLLIATLATALWIPWRFSLRTLLIATTLIAVVLGLIVWLR
jgi:hypothetical protein